jgi:hypothetical protein
MSLIHESVILSLKSETRISPAAGGEAIDNSPWSMDHCQSVYLGTRRVTTTAATKNSMFADQAVSNGGMSPL